MNIEVLPNEIQSLRSRVEGWWFLTDRSNKAPEADGDFYNAPYWYFNDGKLKFNSNNVDNDNSNYGSTSFVLPVCHNRWIESLSGFFSNRPFPSAKHSPDLLDSFLQFQVLLLIERAGIVSQPGENFHKLQSNNRLLNERRFPFLFRMARFRDCFDKLKGFLHRFLAQRITVSFGVFLHNLVKKFVQVIRFLKDRRIMDFLHSSTGSPNICLSKLFR